MPGDLSLVRERFPALRDDDNRVFADAPGGTQVPETVIDAMARYLMDSNANEHGAFATSRETDAVIREAHLAAADFLGCAPDGVVFGQNATTHLFALSRAIARDLKPGDELVVTVLDHDANIAPWAAVAEHTGATLRWADIRSDEDCGLDLASLDQAINPRTKVVSFTLASNAVGAITPAPAVVRRAHEAGAVVVADAVHVAQHRSLDIDTLDADVLVTSAYKTFGPHIGIMYGKRDLLQRLRPYKVRPASNDLPWAWETGTMNHEGMAGYIASIE